MFANLIVCLLMVIVIALADKLPALSSLIDNTSEAKDSLYIINGTVAKEGQYPHICSFGTTLDNEWKHSCGVNIISEEWVLTAQHCLKGKNYTHKTLRCGVLNITAPDIHEYNITEVRKHPGYDYVNVDYDMALLRVDGKLQLDSKNMDVIALPDQDELVPTGAMVTVVGWGAINVTHRGPSDVLRTEMLNVVDNEECNQLYKADLTEHPPNVTVRMMCAGLYSDQIKGTCSGDSGSSAIYDGKVVGLTSWGHEGCAAKGIPTVFTRVASMRDWIKNITEI